ncbi:WXG100-like domain-containing protein, partial [Nocardia sp. NPDC003963]
MIEIWDWAKHLAILAGVEWPEGNEDEMWGLGGDWRSAADSLDDIVADIIEAKRASLYAYPEGDGVTEMVAAFDSLISGDGSENDQSVPKLAEYFRQLGDSAYSTGTEIEYTKLMYLSSLALLAAELAAAWIFPPTAPAVSAAAVAITRIAVRILGQRVMQAILRIVGRKFVQFMLRHVAIDTILGTLQEIGIQGWQIQQNHRPDFDLGQIVVTAVSSAAGGAAAGPVGDLVGNALRNETSGLLRQHVDGMITGAVAGFTGGLGGVLAAIPTQFAVIWAQTGSWDTAMGQTMSTLPQQFGPMALAAGAGNGLLTGGNKVRAESFYANHGIGVHSDSYRDTWGDRTVMDRINAVVNGTEPRAGFAPGAGGSSGDGSQTSSPARTPAGSDGSGAPGDNGASHGGNGDRAGSVDSGATGDGPGANNDSGETTGSRDESGGPGGSRDDSGESTGSGDSDPANSVSPAGGDGDGPASRGDETADTGGAADPAGSSGERSESGAGVADRAGGEEPAGPVAESRSDSPADRSGSTDNAAGQQDSATGAASEGTRAPGGTDTGTADPVTGDRTDTPGPVVGTPGAGPIAGAPIPPAGATPPGASGAAPGSAPSTPGTASGSSSPAAPGLSQAPSSGGDSRSSSGTPGESRSSSAGEGGSRARAGDRAGAGGRSPYPGTDGSGIRAGRTGAPVPDSDNGVRSEDGSEPIGAPPAGDMSDGRIGPEDVLPLPVPGGDPVGGAGRDSGTRGTSRDSVSRNTARDNDSRPGSDDPDRTPDGPDDPDRTPDGPDDPDRTPDGPDDPGRAPDDSDDPGRAPDDPASAPDPRNRGECARLTLEELAQQTGSDRIRPPADPVGPRGMNRAEIEDALGGKLYDYPAPDGDEPRHQAVADELLRRAAQMDPRAVAAGRGPRAFVLDTYAGAVDEYGVGAHAYSMRVRIDPLTGKYEIVVSDPTGEPPTRGYPPATPARIRKVSATILDGVGRVVPPSGHDARVRPSVEAYLRHDQDDYRANRQRVRGRREDPEHYTARRAAEAADLQSLLERRRAQYLNMLADGAGADGPAGFRDLLRDRAEAADRDAAQYRATADDHWDETRRRPETRLSDWPRDDEQPPAGHDDSREADESSGRDEEGASGRDEAELSGRDEDELSGRDEDELSGRDEEELSGRDEDELSGRDEEESSGRDEEEPSGRDENEPSGSDEERTSAPGADRPAGRSDEAATPGPGDDSAPGGRRAPESGVDQGRNRPADEEVGGDPYYRDSEGRRHHRDDPPNTYRDNDLRLRDQHGWVPDPLAGAGYRHRAQPGSATPYRPVDPALSGQLAEASATRLEQQARRDLLAANLEVLVVEAGVVARADLADLRYLTPNKLEGEIAREEQQVLYDESLSEDDRQDRLALLDDLRSHAEQYHALVRQEVLTSQQLGELGGLAYALDPDLHPGAIQLSPFEGASSAKNVVDIAVLVPGTADSPPKLLVVEAKGGSSTLGGSRVSDAQQGSPEYLVRTLAMDKNLATVLTETPAQLRARGIDPDSASGRALIRAREELLTAHLDGTLQVEYHEARTTANGDVTVRRFDLTRDGDPVRVEMIGGIDNGGGPAGRGAEDRGRRPEQSDTAETQRLPIAGDAPPTAGDTQPLPVSGDSRPTPPRTVSVADGQRFPSTADSQPSRTALPVGDRPGTPGSPRTVSVGDGQWFPSVADSPPAFTAGDTQPLPVVGDTRPAPGAADTQPLPIVGPADRPSDTELLGAPEDDMWSALSAAEVGARLRYELRAITGNPEFRVFGFDRPELHPEVVREYARALVDLFTAHPSAQLNEVGFRGGMRMGVFGHTRWTLVDGERRAAAIEFNAFMAGDPAEVRRATDHNADTGWFPDAVRHRPAYARAVHEFGHVLDAAGDHAARREINGHLLREFFRRNQDATSIDDYFAWLGESLSGYSFHSGSRQLNPAEALSEAFLAVTMSRFGPDGTLPPDPGSPVGIIHDLLVRSADEPVTAEFGWFDTPELGAPDPARRGLGPPERGGTDDGRHPGPSEPGAGEDGSGSPADPGSAPGRDRGPADQRGQSADDRGNAGDPASTGAGEPGRDPATGNNRDSSEQVAAARAAAELWPGQASAPDAVEVADLLSRSATGRQAIAVLRAAGATIRFDSISEGPVRPDGFDGRSMEVVVAAHGRDQVAQAAAIVRAAALAEAVRDGRSAVTPDRIRGIDRDAHVVARMAVEAEAFARQADFHREMADWGYDPLGGPTADPVDALRRRELEQAYRNAVAAAAGPDAGRAAGIRELLGNPLFDNPGDPDIGLSGRKEAGTEWDALQGDRTSADESGDPNAVRDSSREDGAPQDRTGRQDRSSRDTEGPLTADSAADTAAAERVAAVYEGVREALEEIERRTFLWGLAPWLTNSLEQHGIRIQLSVGPESATSRPPGGRLRLGPAAGYDPGTRTVVLDPGNTPAQHARDLIVAARMAEQLADVDTVRERLTLPRDEYVRLMAERTADAYALSLHSLVGLEGGPTKSEPVDPLAKTYADAYRKAYRRAEQIYGDRRTLGGSYGYFYAAAHRAGFRAVLDQLPSRGPLIGGITHGEHLAAAWDRAHGIGPDRAEPPAPPTRLGDNPPDQRSRARSLVQEIETLRMLRDLGEFVPVGPPEQAYTDAYDRALSKASRNRAPGAEPPERVAYRAGVEAVRRYLRKNGIADTEIAMDVVRAVRNDDHSKWGAPRWDDDGPAAVKPSRPDDAGPGPAGRALDRIVATHPDRLASNRANHADGDNMAERLTDRVARYPATIDNGRPWLRIVAAPGDHLAALTDLALAHPEYADVLWDDSHYLEYRTVEAGTGGEPDSVPTRAGVAEGSFRRPGRSEIMAQMLEHYLGFRQAGRTDLGFADWLEQLGPEAFHTIDDQRSARRPGWKQAGSLRSDFVEAGYRRAVAEDMPADAPHPAAVARRLHTRQIVLPDSGRSLPHQRLQVLDFGAVHLSLWLEPDGRGGWRVPRPTAGGDSSQILARHYHGISAPTPKALGRRIADLLNDPAAAPDARSEPPGRWRRFRDRLSGRNAEADIPRDQMDAGRGDPDPMSPEHDPSAGATPRQDEWSQLSLTEIGDELRDRMRAALGNPDFEVYGFDRVPDDPGELHRPRRSGTVPVDIEQARRFARTVADLSARYPQVGLQSVRIDRSAMYSRRVELSVADDPGPAAPVRSLVLNSDPLRAVGSVSTVHRQTVEAFAAALNDSTGRTAEGLIEEPLAQYYVYNRLGEQHRVAFHRWMRQELDIFQSYSVRVDRLIPERLLIDAFVEVELRGRDQADGPFVLLHDLLGLQDGVEPRLLVPDADMRILLGLEHSERVLGIPGRDDWSALDPVRVGEELQAGLREILGNDELTVRGFDSEGLHPDIVREFARGLIDMARRYPMANIHSVAFGQGDPYATTFEADSAGRTPHSASIEFDIRSAQDLLRSVPDEVAAHYYNAPKSGGWERPAYTVAVQQWARALDITGAESVQALVDNVLRSHHREQRPGQDYDEWVREQFSGRAFETETGELHPGFALEQVFDQVVTHGRDEADPHLVRLHDMLVRAAAPNSPGAQIGRLLDQARFRQPGPESSAREAQRRVLDRATPDAGEVDELLPDRPTRVPEPGAGDSGTGRTAEADIALLGVPEPDDWSGLSPESVGVKLRDLMREATGNPDFEVFGFELPDLNHETVREFARAVADMYRAYPQPDIRSVGIGQPRYEGLVDIVPGKDDYTTADPPHIREITLDYERAGRVHDFVGQVRVRVPAGELPPIVLDRPVYGSTVREYARALDYAGGLRARLGVEMELVLRSGRLPGEDFGEWLGRRVPGAEEAEHAHPRADQVLLDAFTEYVLSGTDGAARYRATTAAVRELYERLIRHAGPEPDRGEGSGPDPGETDPAAPRSRPPAPEVGPMDLDPDTVRLRPPGPPRSEVSTDGGSANPPDGPQAAPPGRPESGGRRAEPDIPDYGTPPEDGRVAADGVRDAVDDTAPDAVGNAVPDEGTAAVSDADAAAEPSAGDPAVLGAPHRDEWSDLTPAEVGQRLRDLLREATGNPDFAVFGFDLDGLDSGVVREFARAITDMYRRFPQADIRSVGIGEIREGVLADTGAGYDRDGDSYFTQDITLNYRHATNAADFLGRAERSVRDEILSPTVLSRAVYAVTVHEYGHALDYAGGGAARALAEGHLLARALADPDADYGRWLDELSGYSRTPDGDLWSSEALAEAFMEYVMRGADAVPRPVRELFLLLTGTAEHDYGGTGLSDRSRDAMDSGHGPPRNGDGGTEPDPARPAAGSGGARKRSVGPPDSAAPPPDPGDGQPAGDDPGGPDGPIEPDAVMPPLVLDLGGEQVAFDLVPDGPDRWRLVPQGELPSATPERMAALRREIEALRRMWPVREVQVKYPSGSGWDSRGQAAIADGVAGIGDLANPAPPPPAAPPATSDHPVIGPAPEAGAADPTLLRIGQQLPVWIRNREHIPLFGGLSARMRDTAGEFVPMRPGDGAEYQPWLTDGDPGAARDQLLADLDSDRVTRAAALRDLLTVAGRPDADSGQQQRILDELRDRGLISDTEAEALADALAAERDTRTSELPVGPAPDGESLADAARRLLDIELPDENPGTLGRVIDEQQYRVARAAGAIEGLAAAVRRYLIEQTLPYTTQDPNSGAESERRLPRTEPPGELDGPRRAEDDPGDFLDGDFLDGDFLGDDFRDDADAPEPRRPRRFAPPDPAGRAVPFRGEVSFIDQNPMGRFLVEILAAFGHEPGLLGISAVENGADELPMWGDGYELGRDEGLRRFFENALRRDQIRDELASWAAMRDLSLEDLLTDPQAVVDRLRAENAARSQRVADFVEAARRTLGDPDLGEPVGDLLGRQILRVPGGEGQPDRLVVVDGPRDRDQVLADALAADRTLQDQLDDRELVLDYRTVRHDWTGEAVLDPVPVPPMRYLRETILDRELAVLLVRDADGTWQQIAGSAADHRAAFGATPPRPARVVAAEIARISAELGIVPDAALLNDLHRVAADLMLDNAVRAVQLEALADFIRTATDIELFNELTDARSQLADRLGLSLIPDPDAPERTLTHRSAVDGLTDRSRRRARRAQQFADLTDYAKRLREIDAAAVDAARDRLAERLVTDDIARKMATERATERAGVERRVAALLPPGYVDGPGGRRLFAVDPGGLDSKKLFRLIRTLERDGQGELVRRALDEYLNTLFGIDPYTEVPRGDHTADPRIADGRFPMHDRDAMGGLRALIADAVRALGAADFARAVAEAAARPDSHLVPDDDPGRRPTANRDWARLVGVDLTDADDATFVKVYEAYRDGRIENHEGLSPQELAAELDRLRREVRDRADLIAALVRLFDEYTRGTTGLTGPDPGLLDGGSSRPGGGRPRPHGPEDGPSKPHSPRSEETPPPAPGPEDGGIASEPGSESDGAPPQPGPDSGDSPSDDPDSGTSPPAAGPESGEVPPAPGSEGGAIPPQPGTGRGDGGSGGEPPASPPVASGDPDEGPGGEPGGSGNEPRAAGPPPESFGELTDWIELRRAQLAVDAAADDAAWARRQAADHPDDHLLRFRAEQAERQLGYARERLDRIQLTQVDRAAWNARMDAGRMRFLADMDPENWLAGQRAVLAEWVARMAEDRARWWHEMLGGPGDDTPPGPAGPDDRGPDSDSGPESGRAGKPDAEPAATPAEPAADPSLGADEPESGGGEPEPDGAGAQEDRGRPGAGAAESGPEGSVRDSADADELLGDALADAILRRDALAARVGDLAAALHTRVDPGAFEPDRIGATVRDLGGRALDAADARLVDEIGALVPRLIRADGEVRDLTGRIEYDRLQRERQGIIREREFLRAKIIDRARNLGVENPADWTDLGPDEREQVILRLDEETGYDTVEYDGGIDEGPRRDRSPVGEQERLHRREILRKLIRQTAEFDELDARLRQVDQEIGGLEGDPDYFARPRPEAVAAELERLARERGAELQRIKPRRVMRDDLARRLGLVDESGDLVEGLLEPEELDSVLRALRDGAYREFREGGLRPSAYQRRLLRIDALADAAGDVNRAHNRIGRLQDDMARVAGVWRGLVEAEGGRMVTDRVGLIEGDEPRIIVFGPRPDPANPRADHDAALLHALQHHAAVAQAVVRPETTVEYRRIRVDREDNWRVDEPMDPPEVERMSTGWVAGRRLDMTRWRDSEGDWHPVDPTRPDRVAGRDDSELPKKYSQKDLPDGVSGWASEDVINDITLPTDDVPAGKVPESTLPVHAPMAPSQYNTSGVDPNDVYGQHWGADAYNFMRLMLMAAQVPKHPAVKAWIQRHPEIGRWVHARPWLQKLPPFGTVFRGYAWFAPPDTDVQPMHRRWQEDDHLPPAALTDIPAGLRREWDREAERWGEVQRWADEQYDRFLADDGDLDRVARGVEEHRHDRQRAAAREFVDLVRRRLVDELGGIDPLGDVPAQLARMETAIDQVAAEAAGRFADDDPELVRNTVDQVRDMLLGVVDPADIVPGADPDTIVRAVDPGEIADRLIGRMRDEVPNFTRAELEQIKNHLMADEHLVRDADDPTGQLIRRPMDRLADIAEAWHRLREGKPLPADFVLLQDALAEAQFLVDNPGATWQAANTYAIGQGYHWDAQRPPLTDWRAGRRYALPPVEPGTGYLPPARTSGERAPGARDGDTVELSGSGDPVARDGDTVELSGSGDPVARDGDTVELSGSGDPVARE